MKPTNQSLTGSSTLATALNQPQVKHFICREFEFGLVLDSGPIHFDFIWASPLSSCWQAYHMFAETPSGVPVYDVRRLIDLGMLPHAPVLSMKRSIGILSNTKRSFRSAPSPAPRLETMRRRGEDIGDDGSGEKILGMKVRFWGCRSTVRFEGGAAMEQEQVGIYMFSFDLLSFWWSAVKYKLHASFFRQSTWVVFCSAVPAVGLNSSTGTHAIPFILALRGGMWKPLWIGPLPLFCSLLITTERLISLWMILDCHAN